MYRFRDKRHGTQDWKQSQCTTIEQNGEEIKLKRKDDMFYAIYAGWMLDRKSCSNCQFAEINRVADITIADFWGLQVPDYYKQGVSLIIANNNKADTMIKAADAIYTFKESLRTAINGNPHLFTGYKLIQFHPIVMWPDFFRKILPKRIRFKILTNRMPYKLFGHSINWEQYIWLSTKRNN
ncbi:Coenzyme F420 hydrogenase/dehydrogenase, beta subunit C-terminal domain [Bacteroides fragilis]